MTWINATDEIFFGNAGLDRDRVTRIVDEALHGADDGELFLEHAASESLVYDDGRLRSASLDVSRGFGLRSVAGQATGYALASDLATGRALGPRIVGQ